jgi:hypothetical protein
MISLYGQYIKERLNKEIIESEKGFSTYYFINDDCYIEEIYITPEHRHTKEAVRMGIEITKIAVEKGCKRLYGTVVPSTPGATEAMRMLIAAGFKIDSSINNFICVVKDISNGVF